MASLRKRNDKWQAQLRRVGHQPRSKSFLNRADAQRWIRQTELELDRLALAYDPKALERLTVSDLLTRYLAEVTPRKRGAASEAKRIDVFLREKWTGLSLAQISPQAFTQHRDKRLREVKPSTVIRELGLLHAIFEVARLEWDLPLVENPVAKVRKPKAPQGRDRRLESDELAAILKTSEAAKVRWLTPGIVLALETGMRRGEVLNIRATDFDRSRELAAEAKVSDSDRLLSDDQFFRLSKVDADALLTQIGELPDASIEIWSSIDRPQRALRKAYNEVLSNLNGIRAAGFGWISKRGSRRHYAQIRHSEPTRHNRSHLREAVAKAAAHL